MRPGIPTLFAAALVAAFGAHAESFVGANLGSANYPSDVCSRSGSCDKNDSAWSVRAGYALPFVSIEARYFNLGHARAQQDGGTVSIGTGAPTAVSIPYEFKASGLGAGVQAAVPIAPFFAVTGLAGIARVRGEQARQSVTVNGADVSVVDVGFSRSTTTTQPYYGIGLRFTFAPGLDASLDAQRYRVDFGGAGKPDVDFYGVGLTYRY